MKITYYLKKPDMRNLEGWSYQTQTESCYGASTSPGRGTGSRGRGKWRRPRSGGGTRDA